MFRTSTTVCIMTCDTYQKHVGWSGLESVRCGHGYYFVGPSTDAHMALPRFTEKMGSPVVSSSGRTGMRPSRLRTPHCSSGIREAVDEPQASQYCESGPQFSSYTSIMVSHLGRSDAPGLHVPLHNWHIIPRAAHGNASVAERSTFPDRSLSSCIYFHL